MKKDWKRYWKELCEDNKDLSKKHPELNKVAKLILNIILVKTSKENN